MRMRRPLARLTFGQEMQAVDGGRGMRLSPTTMTAALPETQNELGVVGHPVASSSPQPTATERSAY